MVFAGQSHPTNTDLNLYVMNKQNEEFGVYMFACPVAILAFIRWSIVLSSFGALFSPTSLDHPRHNALHLCNHVVYH